MEEGHDSKGYEVGYGKPPIHSRFSKGQSGNRRGRPKGAKNLKTELAEELNQKVLVHEGGRSIKITKRRAIAKILIAQTIKGNARFTNTLVGTVIRAEEPGDTAAAAERPFTESDREILDNYNRRLLEQANAADQAEPKKDDSK